MKIKINGSDETLAHETISISDLLTFKKVDMPEMVTVEVNGDILDRDAFDTTIVRNADTVEFLYFMGGGTR